MNENVYFVYILVWDDILNNFAMILNQRFAVVGRYLPIILINIIVDENSKKKIKIFFRKFNFF